MTSPGAKSALVAFVVRFAAEAATWGRENVDPDHACSKVDRITNDALALLRLAGQFARGLGSVTLTDSLLRVLRPYGIEASKLASNPGEVMLHFPSGATATIPTGKARSKA